MSRSVTAANGRALGSLCEPHRQLEVRKRVLVEVELLRVLQLVEEGRSVVDEDRPHLRR